jgi:hypothetical protein
VSTAFTSDQKKPFNINSVKVILCIAYACFMKRACGKSEFHFDICNMTEFGTLHCICYITFHLNVGNKIQDHQQHQKAYGVDKILLVFCFKLILMELDPLNEKAICQYLHNSFVCSFSHKFKVGLVKKCSCLKFCLNL